MLPVPQIPEPSLQSRTVEILDARVVVGGLDCGARDANPILGAAVLEGDLHGGGVVDVGELLGVDVGDEEEVWAVALGDGHGAGDGAEVGALGGQEADLLLVDDGIEVGNLLSLGGFSVPLFGDGGVGLGGHFGGFEAFRHDGS